MVGHVRRLVPEPLTASAFAPYGEIVAPNARAPDFSRPGLDLWRFAFESADRPRVQIMRYHRQPMRFSRLERHLDVTETRVPIAGAQAVLIVAASTELDQASAKPPPESLRAFVLDGTAGIRFRLGAWHGLDCYPIDAEIADFFFLSDEATELEIEAWSRPTSGRHTHIVDYVEDGLSFEVTL